MICSMTVLAIGFFHFCTAESIDFKCSNQDEFFYATPKTHCSSYYRCYQRQRIKFDCLSGAVFDFYKQKCTRSAGVCYEPVCTGRIDGDYPDTTHACRRSFNCKGGKLVTVDNCPHGYLHSGESCQPQEFVNCDLPETTSIAFPYAGDRRCAGLENGNHGIEDYDCRKYIICENREVIDEAQCPHGLRFHTDTKKCTPSYDVTCSNENTNLDNFCHRLNNGLYTDPKADDCVSYLKCGHGKLISKHSCGPQAVFNGDACVPTPLYQCPKQDHSPNQDICKRKQDGLVIDPRKGCSNYVKCVNGKTVQQLECTKGQYFDSDRKNCVYERFEENKKCHSVAYSSECAQMEGGYYQDRSSRSSCREYFYCFNGNRTNFKCQNGKLFNGELCVDDKNYVCPNLDPNVCDLKADGYYKDKSGGCRSYFYCSAGKKFSYLCAEGQMFDGSKCVEKKNGQQCGKDCLGRPDGYYQDLLSGCRSYYFCLRGEKATSLTCRGSKLFNGDSCVSPDSYICPSHTASSASTNCVMRKCYKECKKDGFYADVDTGCKNYYFCIAGKKTLLSCLTGFVFNGEICVQSEFYQCPRLCGAMIKCQHGHAANFLQ